MMNPFLNKKNFNFILIGLLFCISIFTFCSNSSQSSKSNIPFSFEKHKGVHLFGKIDSTNLQPIKDYNIDWITLVPFGDQKDYNDSIMTYLNGDSTWIKEGDSIWLNQIELAHIQGVKVFLKPHIWLYQHTEGKWRSDIFPKNEKDWNTWKKSYEEFILHFAKVAEKAKAEMFCIGVELTQVAIRKPEFFKTLIQKVRNIYSGKLTYAANWYEEFEEIEFWKELDFIGVQAYFPLVKNKNPSTEEIKNGWKKYLSKLAKISQKNNKGILFTEMGYKSTMDSAIEPWTWIQNIDHDDSLASYETQANCYQAFFESVWKQDWMAGVHLWEMRTNFKNNRKTKDLNFSPQGKPAANIIRKEFGK